MEKHRPKLIDIIMRSSKVVLFIRAQLVIQLKYESLVAESSTFFQATFNQQCFSKRTWIGTGTGSNDFIDGIKIDDKSTEQSFLTKNVIGKSDQQLQMALSANGRKSGSL
uniref:Uncharacterized protein n=1 Tax=Wuchereria bancrofti TaxID=6293 RepID=A0AAF5Q0W5_WUCBA